ncbi:heme o synthase [Virgibacillus sp. 179-BFC.A HS]|uniref:Protoheme IX farnesyltransferase n=1 Tax=Tigheibacillus jepli TaxID=3035914 RepID=A0ABU5CF66_9BACI|nr:heme o synthase [Virgibacillus sp. 179-BFC.A HS]MDY0404977.1 heme o synthase [Virgibacillus sp. 179-BFC.A HS]
MLGKSNSASGISASGMQTENSSVSTVIADLKSLVKFVVLMLNVLPVLTGFLLALHFTNQQLADHLGTLVLVLVGSTLIMAGALILNNWYEVDLDKKMKRTAMRPTVTGNFSLKAVLNMGVIASVIGFAILLFTTVEAAIYALIGWFVYVVLYTFWSKRRYTLNTIIGSVSGAVTPLIGWGAVTSTFHIVPIMLFAILFIWQVPHTFSIAVRRFDDYKAAGIPMLPVVSGIEMTKRQSVIYIACLLPLPFFLISLGIQFVIFATVLNLAWLGIAIIGWIKEDHFTWANRVFKSSITYLTLLFLAMIVVALV